MNTTLVVDDEVPIVEMLRACLQDEGYTVTVASDGREAIGRLEESRPDLVLSDVMMPLMDGRELAGRMEQDPALRDIPLILMSAGGEFIVDGRCSYAAFVAKPFELDSLVRTIGRLLAAPASEPSAAE